MRVLLAFILSAIAFPAQTLAAAIPINDARAAASIALATSGEGANDSGLSLQSERYAAQIIRRAKITGKSLMGKVADDQTAKQWQKMLLLDFAS